ncbi:MAG TPA: M48 family metalloprotease [Patescibacteria group bacterium]|nr:M48 family metalloprotease [Patescibacteria group bacterium]
MRNDLLPIYQAFQGKLVGNKKMKTFVCEVLTFFPDKIIEYITANCWFMASMDDAWAFTFTGNDLKNQHLIFLSDELLSQELHQIYYTIAHEIGHVMLGHRNAVFSNQSKEEISKQEKEADDFAKQFLK